MVHGNTSEKLVGLEIISSKGSSGERGASDSGFECFPYLALIWGIGDLCNGDLEIVQLSFCSVFPEILKSPSSTNVMK
jgi:hypothetical protein